MSKFFLCIVFFFVEHPAPGSLVIQIFFVIHKPCRLFRRKRTKISTLHALTENIFLLFQTSTDHIKHQIFPEQTSFSPQAFIAGENRDITLLIKFLTFILLSENNVLISE